MMLSVYQPNMKLFASSSIFTIYFAIMMVRIVVVNNNKSMVVVHGHGYIVNPISRNYYSHLHGLPSPEFDRVPGVPDAEYCYHCLNTKKAGSVCGTSEQGIDYDAWLDSTNNPMPWNHNGNIYQEGAIITFESYLQSHHTGHLELKVCNKGRNCTQADFDTNPLEFVSDTLYGMPKDEKYPHRGYYYGSQEFNDQAFRSKWKLPTNFRGEQVLLQWLYVTANSCSPKGYADYYETHNYLDQSFWNSQLRTCADAIDFPPIFYTGDSPERFVNCAEIAIRSDGEGGTGNNDNDNNNDVDVDVNTDPQVVPSRGECEDDQTFGYDGNPKKNCKWVKKKNKGKRCNFVVVQPEDDSSAQTKVKDYCPTVCKKRCKPCKDTKKRIQIGTKMRNCTWIKNKGKCSELKFWKRCKKSCDKCPLTAN